jgi:tetratricopeptide (TPR) repeat protein
MNGGIIFDDEAIRVVHRPGASDFSLVTFAALGHRPNGDWLWAGEPIAKLGVEAIGIIAHRPNWFPAAAMEAAATAIRSLLRPQAIGYGFSMGGYGVLKYGRLLGLTHGIAVSPQLSIDPADVPQDRRFHRFHDPQLHSGMAVTPHDVPPVTFVAGDTMWPLDGQHLNTAAAFPCVSTVALRFMQHAAVHRFTSSRELAALFDLVLAGDAEALREHLRRGRSESGELHLWVARTAAARGHAVAAERLWAKAAALGVSLAKISELRAVAARERMMRLVATRRLPEAHAFLDAAVEAHGGRAPGLVRLGQFLNRRGMPAQAIVCYRRALRFAPRLAAAHLGLLEALRDCGSPRDFAHARAVALNRLASSAVDMVAVQELVRDPPKRAEGEAPGR